MGSFINKSTEFEKKEPTTRFHTRHNVSAAIVICDKGQRTRDESDSRILERTVKEFKRMLLEKLDEQFDSRLFTLQCPLLVHMAVDIEGF